MTREIMHHNALMGFGEGLCLRGPIRTCLLVTDFSEAPVGQPHIWGHNMAKQHLKKKTYPVCTNGYQ